jgi:hypothetical protein
MGASPSKPGVLLIARIAAARALAIQHTARLSAIPGASAQICLEMDIHQRGWGAGDPTRPDSGPRPPMAAGQSRIESFRAKKLDAGYTWTQDGGRSFPSAPATSPSLPSSEVFKAFLDAQLNIDIKEKEKGRCRTFLQNAGDFGRSRWWSACVP